MDSSRIACRHHGLSFEIIGVVSVVNLGLQRSPGLDDLTVAVFATNAGAYEKTGPVGEPRAGFVGIRIGRSTTLLLEIAEAVKMTETHSLGQKNDESRDFQEPAGACAFTR